MTGVKPEWQLYGRGFPEGWGKLQDGSGVVKKYNLPPGEEPDVMFRQVEGQGMTPEHMSCTKK